MSLSSSPRIPNSVSDLPRRRPKERKRQDLRSYYGIHGASSSSNTTNGASSGIGEGGPVDYDPVFDSDAFQLADFVAQVNEKPSAQALLQLENNLVKDIRRLNGERRALIYDNYGRILTISETIQQMRLRLDAMSVSWGDFESILESVRKLSTVNESSSVQAASPVTEDKTQQADALLTDWLRAGTTRIAQLTAFDQLDAALEEVDEMNTVLQEQGAALLDAEEVKKLQEDLSGEKAQIQEMRKQQETRQQTPPAVPTKD